MDGILSIQSHVVYGYVGNKAAIYPLQSMGYDVWPIHTVQFSNHTGYGKWQGEVFSADTILKLADGLFDIGKAPLCKAILSGYMGSLEICHAVASIVKKFKQVNSSLLYLCDPVIGNSHCYVKPEVLDFFKQHLSADIITPNQYEAEVLSGISIQSQSDLSAVADYFHQRGIHTVVITGIQLAGRDGLHLFGSNGNEQWILQTPAYALTTPVNGTGDLFSSVFLGTYLKNGRLSHALQVATFCLNEALKMTRDCKERELQVLSVRYHEMISDHLPLPPIKRLNLKKY